MKRNRLKGNTATANRKYKDTVFRMLFSDRKNLLSLYNAINETSYTDAAQLEIVTLENAIYMGMKNDLAFIINTNLFLYEHQSTYNPNMPLRDLFYISSEYQKMVDWKSLYTSTRLRIPTPNFIVFYNGTEKKEDRWVDYLSESYENILSEKGILYRMNRSIQVEGAFGVLKNNYEFQRFLLRGKTKVKLEILLLCMGYNLNKLHAKIQNERTGSHLFQ